MAKDHLSVVIVPWSAFGHLMPLFQLSMALAKTKVYVYVISTPKNIQRLPKISPDLQPYINLVPIPFHHFDPELLPKGAEATVDLLFENTENLKIAYDLLQNPIKQFIGDQLPDWIITDLASHWVVDIGNEYNVPLVYFSVLSAATQVVFSSIENVPSSSAETLMSPPDLENARLAVAYREHEAVDMHEVLYGVNDSGITDAQKYAKILSACKAIAIRSCNEFE